MLEPITSVEELLVAAKKRFREEFDIEPEVAACAPGRVNLIGEHTDYNEGFVFPMCLPMVTLFVGAKISGEQSTIVTANEDIKEEKRVTIDMPNECNRCACLPGKPKWANYVRGVIANYMGKVPAFLAVIVSNVPAGGGLSSSAALLVSCYTFIDALNASTLDSQLCSVSPTDKALACQKAEHDFAGLPCGIMDQFISFMGKENYALLIDCRSLSSALVPFNDPNYIVLIIDSRVKHELTGSEYSTRRKQCYEAAGLLNKSSLREATKNDIQYLSTTNIDSDVLKRARHVVGEIERTSRAAEVLKKGDLPKFGQLMIESHNSLRDDYEVSCAELDQLVEIALSCPGVLGSRMTGGGFGGSTVTLVHKDNVQTVIRNVKAQYKGPSPRFYASKPSECARILQL